MSLLLIGLMWLSIDLVAGIGGILVGLWIVR